MNQYQLLTEAEISATTNKLLALLSDEDLEAIVAELSEAPDNSDMRAGRFGFNPLKAVPATKTKPHDKPKQAPAPAPKKSEPARKAEIKQTVSELKPKEKSALVQTVKAELKKREASPKEVKPAQPGKLKKVVKNLALAAVAATVISGMFGGGNDAPSGTDSSASTQQVQQFSGPEFDKDSGFYKTVDPKYIDDPYGTLDDSGEFVTVDGETVKVQVIDSKPLPSNPNLTVIFGKSIWAVKQFDKGPYSGMYARAEPEELYTVQVFDIKNKKEIAVTNKEYSELKQNEVKAFYDANKFKLGQKLSWDKFSDAYVISSLSGNERTAYINKAKADKKAAESEKAAAEYMLKQGVLDLQRTLRDPDSLKKDLMQMAVKVKGAGQNSEDTIVIVGSFNAKNAFGAYTGHTMFLNYGGTIITASGDPEMFMRLWKNQIDTNGDNIPDRIIASKNGLF